MSDEVLREKNRRSALKRWIAEDVKKIKAILQEPALDRSALFSAYQSFISRHETIRTVQAQIETLLPDADAQDEFTKELDYQTSLDTVRAEAERSLHDASPSTRPSNPAVVGGTAPSSADVTSKSSQQIRLPKYSLPIFSGNFVD